MNIQQIKHKDLSFVVVSDLGDLEAKHLRAEYDFSQLDLEDFQNRQQVPKIEINPKYKLIILDFPAVRASKSEEKSQNVTPEPVLPVPGKMENGNGKPPPEEQVKLPSFTTVVTTPVKLAIPDRLSKMKRILTAHVNFFLGPNYLVILNDQKTPLINEIITSCQASLKTREEMMEKGPEFLFYRIVDLLVDSLYGPMHEIVSMIDQIDKQIVDDENVPTVVEDISTARRNIVVFQSMLKPAITIFQDLAQGKYPEMSQDMKYYYRNVQDHIQKVRYRMDASRELLEGIARSHESLLTARTNEIVKILTIFTAIMLPLTLLASIYGMNIKGLPYAEDPLAFRDIVITMGILAIIMMIIFKLRRWL